MNVLAEKIKTRFGRIKGFSSNQIKMIALITMTIDHLASYGFEIPVFYTLFEPFRLIGRIAAPLFIFALTESIRYTRNKLKLLLRLYLGAVGVGLFVTISNLLFDESIGRFSQANILFTYVYVALYIILIERFIESIKRKHWLHSILCLGGAGITVMIHYLCKLLNEIPFERVSLTVRQVWTVQDLFASFIESPLWTEYGVLFIIMGILMYFAGNKYGKAAVLVLFSLICYIGGRTGVPHFIPIHTVLGYPQYWMLLAVPVILLYNGKKGNGTKLFYYVYYPLHRYLISVAVFIYKLLIG